MHQKACIMVYFLPIVQCITVCIFLCFFMHTFLISQGYSVKIYLGEVESHLFFFPNCYKKNLKPIMIQKILVF